VEIDESELGPCPCLVAGEGPPLVMLAGLSPDTGVAPGPMRTTHERALRPWTAVRTVHYVNRRPGLPMGITLSQLASEIAAGMQERFGEPVDLLGVSTGGSIAQQLAAEHPGAVRRLVLLSTACRLGPEAVRLQRQIAAPTLLVAGGRDRFLPAGAVRRDRRPNCPRPARAAPAARPHHGHRVTEGDRAGQRFSHPRSVGSSAIASRSAWANGRGVI
jgi:pimeloyl-ACP methyl ester carboxylesterase